MIFAVLLALLIVLTLLVNRYKFKFWTKRGFKQVQPSFLMGNALPMFTLKCSMGEFFCNLYNKHKDCKAIGLYILYSPVLVINDAKLLQDIMIRDFTTFHDRPMTVDEVNDPLSAHLVNLSGQKWRDLRVKLSPTFSSGKLKGMFSIIRDCSQVLEKYLDTNVSKGEDVFEFRDLMARFNTNIISSVAFGIDNDCINDPNHIFRRMGARIFERSIWHGIRDMIAFLAPKLFRTIRLKTVDQDVEDFIFSFVKQTVEYRDSNNFSRNDFMQLLIQLKNHGYISVDKTDIDQEEVAEVNVKKIDMNQLAAQAFVFFVAGFESSSSVMAFCLFELARNPKIQRKIQEEVDGVFKSGTEGITFEMLSDLKYLECCVDETLRKYPIVPVHFRTATKDYKIADSDLVIPQGTSVFVPVLGFHRDPEIYDNPMEFKPERFLNSPNGSGNSEGLFYTPFGAGPRNCIAMRLGKLTTKIGLALILSKFNLELKDKDLIDKELEFHPSQFVLTPIKPFNIKITRRSK